MLTAQQRQAFTDDGLMKVPQAIPADAATEMADRIGEYLGTEESIRRNASQAWLAERPAGLRVLTKAGVFDAAAAESVETALAEIYGPGRYPRPKSGGRALVTHKVSEAPWDVPADGWHVDDWPGPNGEEPARGDGVHRACPAATVRRRDADARRLVPTPADRSHVDGRQAPASGRAQRTGSAIPMACGAVGSRSGQGDGADVDRRRRYMDEGAVLDGVPVRVVEVTGEPGDAFVMRADTFHTLAPNSRDESRMMLIKTWVRAGGEVEDDD